MEAVASLLVLTVLSPLLVVIAAAVAMTSRGPIFFRHPRVGQGGRRFAMLKFRTMRDNPGGPSVTTKGDPRITPVGRLLRKTKLDELPELWNVVRGDMALVGPRPEAVEYAESLKLLWGEMLGVRPGVTDPMTLRLRNEEDLLAAAGADYERFYREYLLPYKAHGYREYLVDRTWKRDVAVLWFTAIGIVLPDRVRPPSPEQIASFTRSL
jgi:lipopolysaccharide/colanic/teichoic acid biosynthesis glycosyltransferase